MGFVEARGTSLYYEEQGDGQPILLILDSVLVLDQAIDAEHDH
jgi:hypothetical protein